MRNTPLRDAFVYFRAAWSPRASFHLARVRYGLNWRERLISAVWLASAHVPLTGAAPSMNFKGLPR